jgi:hypothetical protein
MVGILVLILYRGLKSPNKPEVSTPTSRQTSGQDEKEIEQDRREDSEGDGLMLLDIAKGEKTHMGESQASLLRKDEAQREGYRKENKRLKKS